jgi:hypothetical protein
MDLWAEFKLLDKGQRLGRFITQYRINYFIPDKRNGEIIYSYKPLPYAEDAIYRRISDITISMKSTDHLKMPELISTQYEVALSDAERDRYENLKQELILQLPDGEITAANAAALTGKLSQLANGAIYSDTGEIMEFHDRKYALSSLVYCSKCGEIYRRIAWNNRGKYSIVWRCCTRVDGGPSACDAETIQETDLQMATVRAINKALQCSDSMLGILKENLNAVINSETEKKLTEINDKLADRQQELLNATRKMKPYDDIADAIDGLRDQKQKVLIEKAEQDGQKLRIQEMTDFLSGMDQKLIEYDEQMVRKYIERITVYDTYYEVAFKAGIKVEIEK